MPSAIDLPKHFASELCYNGPKEGHGLVQGFQTWIAVFIHVYCCPNHQPQNDRISGRLGKKDSLWLQIRRNFRPYLSLSFGTREIYSFSCKYLSFPKNSWNISLYFFSFPIKKFWNNLACQNNEWQVQCANPNHSFYWGCLRERTHPDASSIPGWLLDFVSCWNEGTLITHALPVSANREVKSYKNERLFCVYMTLLRDFVPEWNSPSGTETGVNWHPYDIFW